MSASDAMVPRKELLEALAWLLAFDELLTEANQQTPSRLGDGWIDVTTSLYCTVLDHQRDQDDLVELFARARELAAQMAATAATDADELGSPLTTDGDPFTRLGLDRLAERLRSRADETRRQRTAWPAGMRSDA